MDFLLNKQQIVSNQNLNQFNLSKEGSVIEAATRLFVQKLAIHNNESLPNVIKIAKVD